MMVQVIYERTVFSLPLTRVRIYYSTIWHGMNQDCGVLGIQLASPLPNRVSDADSWM